MLCYSRIKEYDQCMREAHSKFLESELMQKLTSQESLETVLLPFMIQYKALGLQMTKPITAWIHKAAESCNSMGLSDLASSLKMRAFDRNEQHAANLKDLEIFVSDWNQRHAFQLRIPDLLHLTSMSETRLYQRAYEEVLDFKEPFALVAVEYEMAWLALSMNIKLVDARIRNNPSACRQKERWLERRAAYVERLRLNADQMGKMLDQNPKYLEAFVRAGFNAIQAHTLFVEDCLRLALRLARLRFSQERGGALKARKRIQGFAQAQTFFQEIEQSLTPKRAERLDHEKRKKPRFSADFEVSYKVGSFGFFWKKARLIDISRTGLRLWAKEGVLPRNAAVQLKIRYPGLDQEDLLFRGKVVWSHKAGLSSAGPSQFSAQGMSCHGILFQ